VKDYKETLDRLDEIEAELADWLADPWAILSARNRASSADANAPGTSPPLSEEPADLRMP